MSPDPSSIRRVQTNGIEFAYLEAGQGPLVLCLHGFPDTAWSFVPVLERLAAAGYHAVAPFSRGYAPTALAPDGDYRSFTRAHDVLALLDHFSAQPALVVGHDWGAVTSYLAAALQPQRFRGIVAASIPHLSAFVPPSLRQLRRSRYMGFFQLRGIPERTIVANDFAWLRALIREWSPGWDFSEQDFAPLRHLFSDPRCLHAALAYYRALPGELATRKNWRLLFQPVTVPALVVRGMDDGCIGAELFEQQQRRFVAGYELLSLSGCGHFMQAERPDAFAAAIVQFARTLASPASASA